LHTWEPAAPESLDHLARIDRLIGEMAERHPEAAFLVTVDHGISSKTVYLNPEGFLEPAGFPIRAAISPVADRLVRHQTGPRIGRRKTA
jgi:phosphonoacetate hydrolase